MRVLGIMMWVGQKPPEKYKDKCMQLLAWGEKPTIDTSFDISGEKLIELAKDYEVAIMHSRHIQPSQKELAKGAKLISNDFYIALDGPGKHFHQR
jgi:hypothetical protein